MKHKAMPDSERIMKMVKKDEDSECWNWMGSLKGKTRLTEYGSLIVGSRIDGTRKTISAHRFSYLVFKGQIPSGMFVCHTCDNPKCVNPDHLFLGTRQDNVNDRQEKGRNIITRGENHYHTKLTNNDVLLIRQMRIDGVARKEIKAITGFSQSLIKSILSYNTWKHLLPSKPII